MNIKTIIFALVLLAKGSLTAGVVEPTITAAVKSFIVDLNDWATQDATVYIIDVNGKVLVSDRIQNQSGRIYNLKNLNNGTYTVSVSNDLKLMETSLKIIEDIVVVENTDLIYKPVVSTSDEYIDVNVLTQGMPVTVSVSDEKGEIYTKVYTDSKKVNERFSLQNLPEGVYYLTVLKGEVSTSVVVEK